VIRRRLEFIEFFFSIKQLQSRCLKLLQPLIHPSKYLCGFNRRRTLLRTIPRAFLRDARHRNRFHIRRTKKGDIKGDGNRERDGIVQGVPETWRRTLRGLQIPICVYTLYTHGKHEFIISTHLAIPSLSSLFFSSVIR